MPRLVTLYCPVMNHAGIIRSSGAALLGKQTIGSRTLFLNTTGEWRLPVRWGPGADFQFLSSARAPACKVDDACSLLLDDLARIQKLLGSRRSRNLCRSSDTDPSFFACFRSAFRLRLAGGPRSIERGSQLSLQIG